MESSSATHRMQRELTAASRWSLWRRGIEAAGTQTFSHRRQRNIIMKQLPINILLTLATCRLTTSETVGPTLTPLAPVSSLPTNNKSVHLTSENKVENVELSNPVNMSLECNWTGNQNKQPNITGYWRKGGVEIHDSRVAVAPENQQYRLQRVFNIVREEQLGNYTCVFENEAELDFILAVPQIGERREKPIVSYVGDFVVLTCKMEEKKPAPRTWNWFKTNGTDKEQLFEAQRYDITVDGRNTKLKVKDVSEDDSGEYHCAAVYNISTSTSKMHLKVITIWEPLKPFLSILVEVVILVTAILIYERSHSKKNEAEANGPNADPQNTQPQDEDDEADESTSVRQRKT